MSYCHHFQSSVSPQSVHVAIVRHCVNPFRLNKLPPHYILEEPNFKFRLSDLDIPREKCLNYFKNSGDHDQMPLFSSYPFGGLQLKRVKLFEQLWNHWTSSNDDRRLSYDLFVATVFTLEFLFMDIFPLHLPFRGHMKMFEDRSENCNFSLYCACKLSNKCFMKYSNSMMFYVGQCKTNLNHYTISERVCAKSCDLEFSYFVRVEILMFIHPIVNGLLCLVW